VIDRVVAMLQGIGVGFAVHAVFWTMHGPEATTIIGLLAHAVVNGAAVTILGNLKSLRTMGARYYMNR
jgi:hypothetical protein